MGMCWLCLLYSRGDLIVNLHHFQSYGGYASCKVVEANAGIHSLAMAVAVRVLIPLPMRLYTDQLRNSPFQAGDSMVSPALTSALVAALPV